ncbi:MAG: DinB family protein [Bacteroidia bacterium]|nr:DinB family protein [Bacteroidia bacterium]
MTISKQLAKNFHEVHFGGNWTEANLKSLLADVTWEEANKQVYQLNSIAALLFHINYFVDVTLKVLEGGPLDGHDKFSFDCPPINSRADWDNMIDKARRDADRFAALVAILPEEKLWNDMADPKYGSYYNNIQGIIEHTHYHLGQIALIKKIIRSP